MKQIKSFGGVYERDPRKPRKPKKIEYTEAELANDPSLKWCPYREAEAVWSDLHRTDVRFLRYEEGKVRLATIDGISPLPDLVERTQVRRASSR